MKKRTVKTKSRIIWIIITLILTSISLFLIIRTKSKVFVREKGVVSDTIYRNDKEILTNTLDVLLESKQQKSFADEEFIIPDTIFLGDVELSIDTIIKGLKDVAANIASPIEIAASMENLDIPFSNKYLLDYDIDRYILKSSQAIALGGIGVDLIYTNFYGKTGNILPSLTQIRKLSQSLYISQFFNYHLLKKLAKKSMTEKDLDSMLYIVTYNINRIEEHLLYRNDGDIGACMVLGAWTEGAYLLSQAAVDNPSIKINERVAEQKFFLNELWKMLSIFEELPYMKIIINALAELKNELDKIEFIYKNIGAPWKTVDRKGNPVWYQRKESIALIDNSQVKNIAEKTEKFRNDLFSLKIFLTDCNDYVCLN